MSDAPQWMPFYVADYLADTGELSTLEHGAYMLLLLYHWQHRALPTDDARLARIARVTAGEWASMRDALAAHFMDDWCHKRVLEELAKADETISNRIAAGKAGASARYGKGSGKRIAELQQKVQQTDTPIPSPSDTTTSVVVDAPKDVSRETRKRATRLPENYDPDLHEALTEGLTLLDAAREAAKFKDYWKAKAGADGAKLDWDATWRNWIRRAAEAKGVTPKANGTAVSPTVWLDREDARWAWAANKYEMEKGRKPIAAGSRNHSGEGFEFPASCVSSEAVAA